MGIFDKNGTDISDECQFSRFLVDKLNELNVLLSETFTQLPAQRYKNIFTEALFLVGEKSAPRFMYPITADMTELIQFFEKHYNLPFSE